MQRDGKSEYAANGLYGGVEIFVVFGNVVCQARRILRAFFGAHQQVTGIGIVRKRYHPYFVVKGCALGRPVRQRPIAGNEGAQFLRRIDTHKSRNTLAKGLDAQRQQLGIGFAFPAVLLRGLFAESVQVILQLAAQLIAMPGVSHARKEGRKLQSFSAGDFRKKQVEQAKQSLHALLAAHVGRGNGFPQLAVKQLGQGFVVHLRSSFCATHSILRRYKFCKRNKYPAKVATAVAVEKNATSSRFAVFATFTGENLCEVTNGYPSAG